MKPMLAATVEDINALKFPLLASPKLDGIRAIIRDSQFVSRNLKPIPNDYVRKYIGALKLDGLDGELIVGKPTDPNCFRNTTSGVMSEDGQPDFAFYAFDYVSTWPEHIFSRRIAIVKEKAKHLPWIKVVPQVKVNDAFELHSYEETMLEKGFEGVMLRDPSGHYKFGRSTLKEGGLMKLKQFCDSEAEIIGFEEQMHNANEKTLESGGKAKRSSHKAGLQPMNTLGTLLVRDLKTGVAFGIGTGLTAGDRSAIWFAQAQTLGRIVKYKYFPTGSKDKPRFPVFLGFRDKRDMS